jgi:hypothetical protein
MNLLGVEVGAIPKPSQTMFIKYRVGGGTASNIGVNTLTNLGLVDVIVH